MQYLKVEGTKLIRDPRSGALINQDKNGLNDYMAKRRNMELQKEELNKVKSELNGIKEDISEIKTLMLKLLEKGQNG
jgi:chaperonin cofactor prefoldin